MILAQACWSSFKQDGTQGLHMAGPLPAMQDEVLQLAEGPAIHAMSCELELGPVAPTAQQCSQLPEGLMTAQETPEPA